MNIAQNTINQAEPGTVLWKALVKVAECCALGRKDLETVLGYSQATLSRLYHNNGPINPNSKQGEIALLLIRLYRSLAANVGGDDLAVRAWLNSDNDYFLETPIPHMRKLTGLMDVLLYLDAMRG